MLFASNMRQIGVSLIFKANSKEESFSDFFIDKEMFITSKEKNAGFLRFVRIKPNRLTKEEISTNTRTCRKGAWFLGSSAKLVRCDENHVINTIKIVFILILNVNLSII
jgi:hypothetical protein